MKVPEGGRSIEEVLREIEGWKNEHCTPGSEGFYYCKKTGVQVNQTTLLASVHIAEFGDQHAGVGKVVRIALPYCPICEDEPLSPTTCVHVPMPLVREG
ncbi:MAG: hypothetical protein M1312_02810 [Patescibacteria group bacterium]|nr:hypothetical protein [Patescibacteria group bacterium]